MDDAAVASYLGAMFSNREYRPYASAEQAVLSRDIHCADDETAIEQARRLFPSGLIEIWQGNRLVGRVHAKLGAGVV